MFVWKILYAVRQDSTLECIMFTGDCGTKFYRILAKKCGKKLVTCRQKNIKYCDDQSVIK